jgi:hypothetical protein
MIKRTLQHPLSVRLDLLLGLTLDFFGLLLHLLRITLHDAPHVAESLAR